MQQEKLVRIVPEVFHGGALLVAVAPKEYGAPGASVDPDEGVLIPAGDIQLRALPLPEETQTETVVAAGLDQIGAVPGIQALGVIRLDGDGDLLQCPG